MKMMPKYNYFFYANACHICKHFGEGVFLKRCGKCTMISYCSKEHQREHWSQHKDLCNAICNVLRDNKMSHFLNNKENLTIEEWAQMKMHFMLMVAIHIPRKLEHYEEQMFKFPRSCAVCHNQNAKELEDCPNCPNTSFCTKHKFHTTHKELCYLLKLCFNLDKTLIMNERKIPVITIPYLINQRTLPRNMKDFIDYYIKPQESSRLSVEEETMMFAEYLTRPLTLLSAIQKLRHFIKDENIVIHIIAANVMEIDGIELWEILLHWLSNVTVAHIILIGPELSSDSVSISLCKECQYSNKQLSIQMHDMFYHEYINSISYKRPNVIVGYNAGIHECENLESENDTWTQSLQIIAKGNSPLILTSYTLAETEKEQIRINSILGNSVKCTYCEQNPYCSLRPYRDFETEGVYYQNQYTIIYENLRTL